MITFSITQLCENSEEYRDQHQPNDRNGFLWEKMNTALTFSQIHDRIFRRFQANSKSTRLFRLIVDLEIGIKIFNIQMNEGKQNLILINGSNSQPEHF
jgi:hypothetical protein